MVQIAGGSLSAGRHSVARGMRSVAEEFEDRNLDFEHLSRLATVGELAESMCREVTRSIRAIGAELDVVEHRIAADDPIRPSLHAVRAAICRIQRLADRTIEFSPSVVPAPEKSCDVAVAIERAHQFVEPYMRAGHVQFSFDCPLRPVRVEVAARPLSQVLVDLYQNAVDAMDGSPERLLSVRVEVNDDVRIVVEDTGKGIRSSEIPRIFDLFYTTKGAEGTGLGLYVAREIVENQMQGKLTVEVAERRTRFVVAIPNPRRGRPIDGPLQAP